MGLLDSASAAGALLLFVVAFAIVDGLRCLSCRGQNVYECIRSAMISVCNKGELCRLRKVNRFLGPKKIWYEADCAKRDVCNQPDTFESAHFCCRVSYCNYLPVGK